MLQKAGMPVHMPRVPVQSETAVLFPAGCLFARAGLEFNGLGSDRSHSHIVQHPQVMGSAGTDAAAQCIPARPVPWGGWRVVFTSNPFETTSLDQTLEGFSSPCSQVSLRNLMGSPVCAHCFLPQFPLTNNPVVKPSLCRCHKL